MNSGSRTRQATAKGGRNTCVPDDSAVYAVGDLHGCHELMCQALKGIAADAAKQKAKHKTVVFLGDYIDRGDSSAAILEDLSAWKAGRHPPRLADMQPVFLKGNHEDLMLKALESRTRGDALSDWLANGGRKTLASYKAESASDLAISIPRQHLEFLQSLKLHHVEGGYLFVHAGVRPGIPLEEQDPHDLVWIREQFLDSGADHGYCVVHGHTPCNEPQDFGNRIGIDTGAFFSGTLTLLALEGFSRRFLQAKIDPGRQLCPVGRQRQ